VLERKDERSEVATLCLWRLSTVWHSFEAEEHSEKAVEIAERFSDGQASESELMEARQANDLIYSEAYGVTAPDAFQAARDVAHLITLQLSTHEERAAEYEAECQSQCRLIGDIFGNPFRPVAFFPSWRTDTTLALAQQMYDSRDFSAMPILA